ncbi:MAG: ABC transporter substrate-binding protein, partial [Thermoleophilia bacterium]|nr:ABC transporter substrate-binding protein [Thermoleophilia bacterium]
MKQWRTAVGITVLGLVAALAVASPALSAEKKLTIGVSDALTGPGATYGLPQANAVKMAVSEINAAGGVKVGGDVYMLDVVAYDDKANPTEGINSVRKLIDRDGVKHILGFCCSGPTSAVASFIANEDALMLVGNAAERTITTQGAENLFRTRPPADYTGAAAGAFVASRGVKTVAVLGALEISFYMQYVDSFKRIFEEKGGKVVAMESFSNKDRDMTPQLTKIKALNPDAILVPGYVEPASFVYRQAAELGMTMERYGFTSGSEEQFLKAVSSEQMEGVWDLRPIELVIEEGSNGKAFYDHYTKMYGTPPSPSAPYAYDQTYVLKDAMEKAGTVDDIHKLIAVIRELPIPKEAVMQYIPTG